LIKVEDFMGVLEFLEQSALATFIRESSSLLAFPTFLCAHTLGLSLLVGANTVVSIRMLGVASSIPLQPLRRLFPFMWGGFILSVISGGGLAMAKATTMLVNPILLTKLVLVAFAIVIMGIMEKKVFRSPSGFKEAEPRNVRILAVAELVLWFAVMVSGRLIAYSTTILGL
jgi:hypothetical protein